MPTTWTENDLSLELVELPEEYRVTWRGSSKDREPARFLQPILTGLLDRAKVEPRRIVLDFTAIEYMNSSTFAPLVKTLEQARRAGLSVTLEFAAGKKWQAMSFTALKVFETRDGRIAVRAR